MNKTFKRAVSSVLASAMAFSSVTVATVSTTLPFTAAQAFAAETTTVASWKSGDATIPAAFGAEAHQLSAAAGATGAGGAGESDLYDDHDHDTG